MPEGILRGPALATLWRRAYPRLLSVRPARDRAARPEKHREATSNIWNIREAYLSLLADIRDGAISMATLRQRRDDLQA